MKEFDLNGVFTSGKEWPQFMRACDFQHVIAMAAFPIVQLVRSDTVRTATRDQAVLE